MKSFVITSALLLTLVLASVTVAEAQARKVLQPTELCSDNPPTAIATFEDADLEAAVRTALSVSAREDLTCGLVSGLTALTGRPGGRNQVFVVYGAPRPRDGAIPDRPFESLVGIQNLTRTSLTINDRSVTDLSALSGLTSLTSLNLHTNRIRDLSALSGLTSLTELALDKVYLEEYGRTGFQGGLNVYRSGGIKAPEQHLFAGRTIDQPSLFIASDWGPYQNAGALERMQNEACTDMRAAHMVDGAGHWVELEQPEETSRLLIEFLRDVA